MSADEGGRVIHRDFGGLAEVKERGAGPRHQQCRHTGTVVDEVARTVGCATCGAPLDPIQLLLEYARHERHWRHWEAEVGRCQTKLEELKAEERKVKARTKSASRKDSDEAVRAERERTFTARHDTIQLARDVGAISRRIEQLMSRKGDA